MPTLAAPAKEQNLRVAALVDGEPNTAPVRLPADLPVDVAPSDMSLSCLLQGVPPDVLLERFRLVARA